MRNLLTTLKTFMEPGMNTSHTILALIMSLTLARSSAADIDWAALHAWQKQLEREKQEEQAAKKARAGWSTWFQGTQEECIIDKMPRVQNDEVARIIAAECAKLPERDGPFTISAISGVFGTKTAAQCVLENGADIRSPFGARLLSYACYRTYPKE